MTIAIWQRLADDRLNMLVTAQNKITFLEREAARHVAQIEKARNALVAVKAEAEASALERITSIAGHLECAACYELLCDPVILIPCGHTACARCALEWMSRQKAALHPLECICCRSRLTRRPVRDVTVRKAAETAMSLLNPQRLAALGNKRGAGFADGSEWAGFTFATDQ
ncbi:hypothetical protein EV121DRAFT_274426 [Schizophyllum commune]